jgi:hypothetical protein
MVGIEHLMLTYQPVFCHTGVFTKMKTNFLSPIVFLVLHEFRLEQEGTGVYCLFFLGCFVKFYMPLLVFSCLMHVKFIFLTQVDFNLTVTLRELLYFIDGFS